MNIEKLIKELERFNTLIDELNNYSSTDFVNISKHLKSYYLQSRKITENAIEISRLLNCRESKDFFKVLDEEYEQMKVGVINFHQQLALLGDFLERLQTNFTLITISFNNFKHSTSAIPLIREDTFQMLDDITDVVEKDGIMHHIDNYKATANFVNAFVVENFAKIRESLTESLKIYYKLKNNKCEDSDKVVHKVSKILSLYASNHKNAVVRVPLLVEKSVSCAMCIDKIITDVQYHDIIRQKLEHIRGNNIHIIDELKEYQKNPNGDYNYIAVIDSILEIHNAILDDTNNNCQLAFGNISNNLAFIQTNNNHINEYCGAFADNIHFYEYKDILEIKSRLSEVTQQFFSNIKFDDSLTANAHSTSDLLKDVEWYVEEFNTIGNETIVLNNLFEKNKYRLDSYFIKEFTNHFENLNTRFSEISDKVHELTLLLLEWAKKLDALLQEELEHQNSNIAFESVIVQQVKEAIKPLNDKNQIHEIVSQNSELLSLNNITIEKSVGHIDNSVFFEENIKKMLAISTELIWDVATLNLKVVEPSKKQDVLSLIESKYTMQSERIIHDAILNDTNPAIENNSEESIELF